MTEPVERAAVEAAKLADVKQDKAEDSEDEETLADLVARARAEISRGEVYPLGAIL